MSVNFGAGLAPAPNNPNANVAPPPQQPVAQPNVPTVGSTAATASPLTTPPADDSALDSTDPTLTNRQSRHLMLNKLREDWVRVEKAIQEGDLNLVHQMLNDGLVPCLVEEDASGMSLNVALPKYLFMHLQDIELFDRFISLFTRNNMQAYLYRHTIQAGNGILLRRLVQSGVEGWRAVSSQLVSLIASVLSRGDAKQLNALLRLKKESFSSQKLDWVGTWLSSMPSKKNSSSTEVVAVLISHLKPSQFSSLCQANMFRRAGEAGDYRLVTALLEWLGDDIDAFSESPFWRDEQGKFSPDALATIVKGGFPKEAISLPSPEKLNAQEFQLILYGPDLSNSPFAQMLVTAADSPEKIVNFVFCKGFSVAKGPFHGELAAVVQFRGQAQIATDLFQNGLTASLAFKLAQKMHDFLNLYRLSAINHSHGLAYLAYLNECVHPDNINPIQDALSIKQAEIIHEASLAVLEQKFGGPIGFYSRALACIRTDGSVDTINLSRIYRQHMGLPASIVAQIGVTLKAVCAEVIASTFPLGLIKPGMTGADVQAAFHRWIQQGVAQRLIRQLPLDLRRSIAKLDWDVTDDRDSDEEEDSVAVAQLISPVNYLITSLIGQYGDLLADDVESNGERIVQACRALPAEAFHNLGQGDDETNSSDQDSSSADEDSDSESSS